MFENEFPKISPPEPTKANPFIQVDWIFHERASICNTKSTVNNYTNACSFYKKYLQKSFNYNSYLKDDSRFYLEQEWDKLALHKVKKWIESINIEGSDSYMTSYYVAGILSAIRQTMVYAYECGYIKSLVFDINLPQAVRETNARTAYAKEEYEAIFKVINPLAKFAIESRKPYKKTGVGKDPRINVKNARSKILNNSWACWKVSDDGKDMIPSDENMRWYFENVMHCQPLASTPINKLEHKHFFDMAARLHGGLNLLYRRWGVSSCIDQNIVMPLVVKLISETGLNVESVRSLRRDCFKESHPLTGLPCIEYNKPRSGGEKTLVLELLDGKQKKTDLLKLGQKQSQIIAKTIKTILDLTEPLVSLAENKDKNYLLLYQSSGTTSFGKVSTVKKWTITNWARNIVKDYDLRDRDGNKLQFYLARFRPTKITELVKRGYDIFAISSIAGHSSITTTLKYVDKLETTNDFHRTIDKELRVIKNNAWSWKCKPLPIATKINSNPTNFIFKSSSFSYCKDPYDPPTQIKNRKNYFEGQPCTYFNMCLQCKNVLITEMNLPKLVAYKNEINRALNNGIDEMPRQGEIYKKNLAIIEQILTPNEIFSEDAIAKAIHIADQVEFDVLDSFIF